MNRVKYIQFRLSNMLRAWVSRKVCQHIMPDYEPMQIYISGTQQRVAFNGRVCGTCTISHQFEDSEGWSMTQCLEGASCMNAGIKVWTNSKSGAVVIQDLMVGNMRV